MNANCDIRILCLLSIQRALLGNVISKMRQGWLLIDGNKIVVTFVVDGVLLDEEQEALSSIETELLADLPSDYKVEFNVTQSFEPIEKQNLFFLRHELGG